MRTFGLLVGIPVVVFLLLALVELGGIPVPTIVGPLVSGLLVGHLAGWRLGAGAALTYFVVHFWLFLLGAVALA